MEKKFPLKTLIFVLILLKIFVTFWIVNNLVLFRENLTYLAHKPVKAKFAQNEVLKNFRLSEDVYLDIYGIQTKQKKPILLFFINHFWKGAQVAHYAHLAKFMDENFSKKFLQIFVSMPREALFWPGTESYYQKEKKNLLKLKEFLLSQIFNFGGDIENVFIFSYESGATAALNFLALSNLNMKLSLFWAPIFPKYNKTFLEKNYFFSTEEEREAYTLWAKIPKKTFVIFSPQKELPDFLKDWPTIPFEQNPIVALFRLGRGEEVDKKIQKIWQDILD